MIAIDEASLSHLTRLVGASGLSLLVFPLMLLDLGNFAVPPRLGFPISPGELVNLIVGLAQELVLLLDLACQAH